MSGVGRIWMAFQQRPKVIHRPPNPAILVKAVPRTPTYSGEKRAKARIPKQRLRLCAFGLTYQFANGRLQLSTGMG
jgi:hypothetical protein